ncbi:uncharacterized protein LOC119029711 [Acanthopagrus latus]|uniref:uncharacterized protein LOC119029711 n=1 Tax=Acanthopagrus latus TaxID=8177 RepID=UPI00187BE109|nr:uncharacterized protein LOC119029711 [Acanthopagrus latus]
MFNNCQSKEKTNKTKAGLKTAWDVTTDGISQFTDFLKMAEPRRLMSTIEVLKEREVLKACIENLRSRVEDVEKKQREVQDTKDALKKHQETMKSNENFTKEVDEPYKEKQDIQGGRHGFFWRHYNAAVSCLICQETCHDPCTMAKNPKGCEMLKKDNCKVCTRKCKVSDHVKDTWIFVTKTKKVTRTMKDLEAMYNSSKAGSERESSILENLQKEMEKLQKDKDQMLDESFQHVVNLEQIALKVDSLSTHVHLDFLIEKMKEKRDTEKIQKLEEMKSRVEETTRAAARYRQTGSVEEVKK